MSTTMYFLRHGKTKVDKDVPVSKWVLSDSGVEQANDIAAEADFTGFDAIFASGEEKARQTAQPIADKLGLQVLREPQLNELDRDAGGFMSHDEYEHAVDETLVYRDVSVSNWETATHALERFSKKVEEIEQAYKGKKILIVGHGMTMNLYFAKLLNKLDDVHVRLEQNDFCNWGVVEDGRVIKDLGK